MSLFCYEIHVTRIPSNQIPKTATVRQIVLTLLAQRFARRRALIATDYHSTLVSCAEMPKRKSYRVTYRARTRGSSVSRPRTYAVNFKPTCHFSSQELMHAVSGSVYEARSEIWPRLTHVLNVILRHFPENGKYTFPIVLNPYLHARSSPTSTRLLRSKPNLELTSQFRLSAHAAANRVLVSLGTQSHPLCRTRPLSALIRDAIWNRKMKVEELENHLIGIRVTVTAPSKPQQGQRNSFPGATSRIIRGLAKFSDGEFLLHPPNVGRPSIGPQAEAPVQETEYAMDGQARARQCYVSLKYYPESGEFYDTFTGD